MKSQSPQGGAIVCVSSISALVGGEYQWYALIALFNLSIYATGTYYFHHLKSQSLYPNQSGPSLADAKLCGRSWEV